MCGLAGIVRFDRPGEASRAELAVMRARLRHRGPDGEGEDFGSHVALGHTRLAMRDPAGGAQPMRSADGRLLLVYNGELWNDAALRAALPGPFRSRSDTETLLAAWAAWGEGCLDRLDGMYAFFLWDEARQVGFAARDPLGVKPLLYRKESVGLAFASEARALVGLPGQGAPRADLEAIVEYLVAPAMSGVARAPFSGLEILPPGHLLRVDRAGLAVRSTWRWSPRPAAGGPTEDEQPARELAAEVRAALARATREAARADAPVGVFLSGGLDSTALAALAREEAQGRPAFTITFDGQDRWGPGASALVVSNDTPFARAAAAELGLELEEVRFDRAGLAAELAALARANDLLPAWEQELSQRALARSAAGRVKAVLVGDAADETHFGYHFLLDEEATSGPAAILRRLGTAPVRAEVDPDPVGRLDAEYRALVEAAGGAFGTREERVVATTHLIVRRWLPRLLHNGDAHLMAFGIEPRVPFCARPLLDAAARVGPGLGLQGGVEKALLREALRGVVPEAIRTRRKSALPKEQDAGPVYREEARGIARDPHPLVRRVVDLERLAPLLTPGEGAPPLDERGRAVLFRVIALHHWAVAHEVVSP